MLSSCVTAALKHAACLNFDPNVPCNCRPISKLPFLSRIVEKTVFNQLQTFLNAHSVGKEFQSGFKFHHSTEPGLLRALNDLLLTIDSGRSVVLAPLGPSAASGLVNHSIHLSSLENTVGLNSLVLVWIRFYPVFLCVYGRIFLFLRTHLLWSTSRIHCWSQFIFSIHSVTGFYV